MPWKNRSGSLKVWYLKVLERKPLEMGVYEFDPNKNGFDWREGTKACLGVLGLTGLLLVSLLVYFVLTAG
jgi:hypothetical protein